MHQRQPLAALPQAIGKILADEMRVGDIIDNAHRVIAVARERIQELVLQPSMDPWMFVSRFISCAPLCLAP